MDPVSLIVTALAGGALAGLKPTAEAAVKDAYAGLKALIVRRFGGKVDVDTIERDPESEKKRDVVAEDLQKVQADADAEVVEQAKALLELIRTHAPETGPALGIDLEGITAGSLRVRKVVSEGTGVRLRDSEFRGDLEFGEVRAGKAGDEPDPR